jgi:hypothetical protein
MKHKPLESDDNNVTLDPSDTITTDNSAHNNNKKDNKTATKGVPLVRKQYHRTIEDDETASPKKIDFDKFFDTQDQDAPEYATNLPRDVGPALAKQQIKDKLQEAMTNFTFVEAEKPDKVKEETLEESWHIRDQITRGYLGKDDTTKARLLATIRRLRNDRYLTTLDPIGLSIHAPGKNLNADFAMQKDSHGNVVYEFGQTLDRRKAKSQRDDGVTEPRHYGSARNAKRSPIVSEFNLHRDEPLSFSITDATNTIEEIRAGLGPLWSIVEPVVCSNMKSAEVGYRFGKTDPQASAVGNVILQIAIEEVAAIYRRIDQREASDLAYVEWLETQDDALAVPARRLKRALSPNQQSLVFRHNQPIKSMLLATNDNDSRYLAA